MRRRGRARGGEEERKERKTYTSSGLRFSDFSSGWSIGAGISIPCKRRRQGELVTNVRQRQPSKKVKTESERKPSQQPKGQLSEGRERGKRTIKRSETQNETR